MSDLTIKASEPIKKQCYKTAPGPRGHFLPRSIPDLQRDPLKFLMDAFNQYGDVVRVPIFTTSHYLAFHPESVKHVLQENYRNYIYRHKNFKPFLGEGLLSSDGQTWLHQRRLIQPAFHHQRLASFGSLITNATNSMLERWDCFAERGQPIDVAKEMSHLTRRIISEVLFSSDLTELIPGFNNALTIVSEQFADRFYAPILSSLVPFSIPIPHYRHFQTTRRMLDRLINGIITERRQQSTNRVDLLSFLLQARNEKTGQGMTNQQIRDEIMTLLMAGHETNANTLTWTWYLLSQHSNITQRVHEELEVKLGEQHLRAERIDELPYLRMVLQETMRLYAPIIGINRIARVDDELLGYHIPANSYVWLSAYITHRHPKFWEHPETFDPERFTPERSVGRPSYAYFPFGGGPRLCLGSNFALMEAMLIAATIAQSYQLHLVPGYQVEIEPVVTLRTKHGLLMTLERRKARQ